MKRLKDIRDTKPCNSRPISNDGELKLHFTHPVED